MILISQIRFFWLIQNECVGFSNFYLETSKYKDDRYYVIYDCFNKGYKEFSTRDSQLSNFDLYIKKLEPTLECRTFLTVFHDARVETDPGLLVLAYAVRILEHR